MHCLLITGMFSREAETFIVLLDGHGLGWACLAEYLSHWQWPQGYAKADEVCSQGKLTGSASDLVSFAPVLGHFV
eukprot:7137404-Pyramimonas_sp.AAC.1